MFNKIKEFFTGKPAEVKTEEPAAPYKIDPLPAGTEASIIASPVVEAVVVVPEAVVPAGVVEQALAKPKAPAVKKPRVPKVK